MRREEENARKVPEEEEVDNPIDPEWMANIMKEAEEEKKKEEEAKAKKEAGEDEEEGENEENEDG